MISEVPRSGTCAPPPAPLIGNGARRNGAAPAVREAAFQNGAPPPASPDGDSQALHAGVLALNRNFAPLHAVSVRRAFCLLYKELAEVIHVENGTYLSFDFEGWRDQCAFRAALGERDEHEDWIRAVHFEIQVPRVIRLVRYDRLPRTSVKFNRRNVFLRDEHRCQYCGRRYAAGGLSLDHVVPRSRGGDDSWENVVCACLTCNVRKGGRTPREAGMRLLCSPRRPPRSPLLSRQLSLRKYASWRIFLGD